MLCPLIRWLISRKTDTGVKMPEWGARHVERCESCRAYAAFSESLPDRLSEEVSAHLAAVPGVDARRIPFESVVSPAGRRAGRRHFLRPFPVAAIVLTLGAAVVLIVGVRRGPTSAADEARAALAGLKRMTTVTGEWPGIIATAESSLEKERLILEKAARSACAYLQDRLNISIERKDATSS